MRTCVQSNRILIVLLQFNVLNTLYNDILAFFLPFSFRQLQNDLRTHSNNGIEKKERIEFVTAF